MHTTERMIVILIILLAWALRWIALMEVPPGWRDDDLVEVLPAEDRDLYTIQYEPRYLLLGVSTRRRYGGFPQPAGPCQCC